MLLLAPAAVFMNPTGDFQHRPYYSNEIETVRKVLRFKLLMVYISSVLRINVYQTDLLFILNKVYLPLRRLKI